MSHCGKGPSGRRTDRVRNSDDARFDNVRDRGGARADAVRAADKDEATMRQERRDAIVADQAAALLWAPQTRQTE